MKRDLRCLQGDTQYPNSFQQTMGTPVITFSKPYMYFCAAREYHFGKLLSYATTLSNTYLVLLTTSSTYSCILVNKGFMK